jgi:glycosyltransferase involved in cell wall biosynthesis
LKLLFISTQKAWYGGEEQLRLLIEGATAAGHRCRVIAREQSTMAKRAAGIGVDVVQIPAAVRGPRSIWRVRRALRQFRPDVVHANDPHGLSLQRTATWGLRVPARICSRRVLFPIVGTRKYRAGCDRVVCVSHAVAQLSQKSGIPESMLRVVHDGADPMRMHTGDACRGRAALSLAHDVPLVLCVAQMNLQKGHQYLLDAIPIVLKTHPRAIFALAGDGPLHEILTAQSEKLGIEAATRFLGYRADVPDLIQACDLVVLPAFREGLGSSVLDAIFAGKAVVGANAGGIPEMLRDGQRQECGWLVAPRDPAALAHGISEALAAPCERARRVALARNWAASEFTAATMIHRTLEVYSDVLG